MPAADVDDPGRSRDVVHGPEREWEEYLGPEVADRVREALTRLRDLTDRYR
ncbi:hypothetical protein V2J52_04525 [Georgenia sp. MJ173]|uniref:hypothetical protein n=1 Tax=Georgenia sunbinii TaxID=3117728 RepID=UPI002F2621CC